MSGTTDPGNIGLRLTGDASQLNRTLDDSGRNVAAFGQKANAELGRFAAGTEASSKQIAYAIRGLPAQFTDIVTSIQGGQKPLTVFMQQGGQIKDMFGGIGPAVRAVGGYISGLVNPFTVAAGAVGILAVAYHQGSQEAQGYTRAITMSGNAAGTTRDQLTGMAQQVGAAVGTVGSAAEVLAQLVASGDVATGSLVRFATVAQKLDRIDVPVKDTVKALSDLAGAPLQATLKLNEKYGYLTESVYKQVKALEDQGKTIEAGRVAQEAYMRAMEDRAATVTGNLGTLEKGWNAIKDAAKGAWDAMLGIGRETSLAQQIATLEQNIKERKERNASVGIQDGAATKALVDQLELLKSQKRVMESNGQVQAGALQQVKALAEWDKEGLKSLSDKLKMEKEITQARELGARAGRTQAEIETRVAAIRETYKKAAPTVPGESVIASISEQTAQLRAQQGQQETLTSAEKLANKTLDDLRTGHLKVSAAVAARIGTALQLMLTEDKAESVREKGIRLAAENAKIIEKNDDAARKEDDTRIKALESQIKTNEQLREEIALIGLNEVQRTRHLQVMEEEAIKRLELDKIGLQNIEGTQAQVEAIEREIEVRKQRIDLLGDKGQRESVVKALQASKQDADSIANAITDNLMRGGKSFWQYMKDAARTTVLRPIILASVSAVGSALTGLPLGSTGAGGGLGGLNGLLGSGGGLGGVGSTLGAFGSGLSAGSSSLANGVASLFGAGNGTTIAGGLDAGITALGAGNIAGGLGTLMPYVGAAMAIYTIGKSLFSSKGGRKVEGYTGNIGSLADNTYGGSLGTALSPFEQQANAFIHTLGGSATAGLGMLVSADPRGTAQTLVGNAASVNGVTVHRRDDVGVGRDDASMQAAIERQAKEAFLFALSNSDAHGALIDWLRRTDILSNVDSVYEHVQAAMAQRATLEQRLFDLSATDLERLNRARDTERASIDDTNKAMLEEVYARTDLATMGAKLQEAYANESQQLQSTIDQHRNYAQELRDFRDSLVTSSQSPLGLVARTSAARDKFEAIAASGTGDLKGAASTYLTNLAGSARTTAEYAVGFAKISAALSLAAVNEDAKATIDEQQLDAMKAQLTQLGLLNTNVQTFAQVLASYSAQLLVVASATANTAAAGVGTSSIPVLSSPGSAAAAAPSGPTWHGGGSEVDGGGWVNADGSPYNVPAFGDGGDHLGGYRVVGERGWELEATGPSRIFNASEAQQILAGAVSRGGAGQDLGPKFDRMQVALEALVIRTDVMADDIHKLRMQGAKVKNVDGDVPLKVTVV